jgi:bifunctional DNA-binding transcriptional regulator/antitoxin component of YhaV-PrlF toxin-antitoxin module
MNDAGSKVVIKMTELAYAKPDGLREERPMQKRVVRQVTGKRQLTIPKEMFEAAGLGDYIQITLDENKIIIEPLSANKWSITEDIINDLATEGVSAQEMAKAYHKRRLELEVLIDGVNKEIDESFSANPDSGKQFLAGLLKEKPEDE